MHDDYIKLSAPKSTGREYFNLDWLMEQLRNFNAQSASNQSNEIVSATDIQATLLAFTTESISNAIKTLAKQGSVYLCGGGVHNTTLVDSLKQMMNNSSSDYEINTMEALNIDGDILEAMAFSWLAYAFDKGFNSNMPAVTGASASCTLGSEYLP
jgi:anhydro-N-acetylmuramic acid kinase